MAASAGALANVRTRWAAQGTCSCPSIRIFMHSETNCPTNRSEANTSGCHVVGVVRAFSSASAKRPPETPPANASAIDSLIASVSIRRSGSGCSRSGSRTSLRASSGAPPEAFRCGGTDARLTFTM